eukprot:3612876-Pleurochrysis_carterae.AAC.1
MHPEEVHIFTIAYIRNSTTKRIAPVQPQSIRYGMVGQTMFRQLTIKSSLRLCAGQPELPSRLRACPTTRIDELREARARRQAPAPRRPCRTIARKRNLLEMKCTLLFICAAAVAGVKLGGNPTSPRATKTDEVSEQKQVPLWQSATAPLGFSAVVGGGAALLAAPQ